jgi:hypothetical protein
MIITDKSEVFQKLLKDIEDIKIKLFPYHRYYVGYEPIEEKKQPAKEFKAGDWVVRTVEKPSMGRDFGRVFRIKSTQGSQVYADDHTSHFSSSLRLATNDEIENHLIKEAIKRGLIGCGKFKWDNEPEVSIMIAGNGYEYDISLDALMVAVGGRDNRRAIYRQGKWATPVFTKEPPKTIQELERLLKDFASKYYGSDLLSERDTDIELFLRRNDYK